MGVELNCKICGKEFIVSPYLKSKAKYCSRTCAGKAKKIKKRVKLVCDNCGKAYSRPLSHALKGKKTHFCSQKCYDEFRITRREINCKICGETFIVKGYLYNEEGNYCSQQCFHKSTQTAKEKICIVCGKSFKITPSQEKIRKGIYCSHKCMGKANQKKYMTNCPICGKEFETLDSRLKIGKGKYCSPKCAGKAISGENHYLWNGGSSFGMYCPKFNHQFKERVRRFWNRKCGICGKDELLEHKKLAVHHVNYEKNSCCNSIIPLFIPLCWSCHGKTNHNRYYWESVLTEYIMIYFNGDSYLPK